MEQKEILSMILAKIDEIGSVNRSEYMKFKDACSYLGVTKTQLYRLMYERQITYSKPSGKITYFKKSDLDDYLTRNTVPSLASVSGMASDYVLNSAPNAAV